MERYAKQKSKLEIAQHDVQVRIGESGSGKAGKKYSYYSCLNRKRGKGCNKKPIRQDLIEPLILEETRLLLADQKLLEYIADITWKFYCENDTTGEEIEALKAQLEKAQTGQTNLFRAVEEGMSFKHAKGRIDELEEQINQLNKSIAELEMSRGVKLTRDHILYFLEQFRDADTEDRNCQKRLVSTFINSIYLSDDGSLKIVYNYSGEGNTVTLDSIEKATTSDVFECDGFSVHRVSVSEHSAHAVTALHALSITLMPNAFMIAYKMPQVN